MVCALAGALALSTYPGVEPTETSALFSASSTSSGSTFTGATFNPTVAPVVVPSVSARTIRLSWTQVTSSKTVMYEVSRTEPGSTTNVCTGSNPPIVSQGVASCEDSTAQSGVAYTYSERPILAIAGSTPWSLPASAPSATVVAPRLTYIDSGPDVSSIGPVVTVPYPPSTEVGDLLLLIAVCGANKAPAVPAGWTQLVSRGSSGTSSIYLLIAWREADGANSTSFDPRSNGTGTSVRIVNYGKFRGNTASPAPSAVTIVSGTANATTSFTPSPDVSTTGSTSTVISVVALSAANSPTVSSPRSFTQRISQNLYPGSGALSIGLADAVVSTSGASAPSPTWSQAGSPIGWMYATFAFR